MELYRSLNGYFKEKYHTRIQKITVSLPFTCPHMNTDKLGGCVYCHKGSMPPGNDPGVELSRQIMQKTAAARERYGENAKFIVYYQTYTNTNAPVEELKVIYDEALNHPDIIGIDVGTRPDCAPDGVLALLDSYCDKLKEVWVEFGLQSANDETLARINRGHRVEQFVDAVNRAKKTGLKIAAHIIIGLPGEAHEDHMKTAELIASLSIHGIKIHPLYIMKDTPLGDEYRKNPFKLMNAAEYIKVLADIVEVLPPDMVLMRFTSEGDEKSLLAPDYCRPEYKAQIKQGLIDELTGRGTRQGSKWKG